MSKRCAVIVVAKAPRPGYAKTRLIPALGAAGAAALAERLLDHAVDQALAADLGAVELCCAPDRHDDAFRRHGRRGVVLSDQGDGDLGARMARAFERRLSQSGADADGTGSNPVLLIGTDAPALDAAVLRDAAAALDRPEVDAVFVPALDGGYALVGLRRSAPSLFDGIAWSTPSVLAQTRERIAAAGLRHLELAPLADIDDAADLAHLPPGWGFA